jgi:PleD family two-component response regulator
MSLFRKKIILVDDVNFSLISTTSRLEKHYDIYPANSAEKMFEILERILPDLILLDINMPDIDGFEAIQRLKSLRHLSRIPVIFLSGKSDKSSIIKGLSLGAADFMTKPFTDTELIDCIEMQLNVEKRAANKPIILAVDDNPSELAAINGLLEKTYTVYTLPEPGKLKFLLDIIEPDLFLLDYNMPVMSGFDLVPIIRGFRTHAETPIIFITSEGSTDTLTAAIHLNACDFLLKPIDEAVLREKVATHTAEFMLRRRTRVLP